MPLAVVFVPRRTTPPFTHKSPSPNIEPNPPFCLLLPWKNKHAVVGGRPCTCSTTVSFETCGLPDAEIMPPLPKLFAQPSPGLPACPGSHGHTAPLPSPKQNAMPVAPPLPQLWRLYLT